jgi:hypothetical protein
MGQAKAQKEEKQARRRGRRGQGPGASASWIQANGEMLAYCVAAVAQRGGALRLGYTRDGGAFSVGVYGDGEPYTEYVSPKEDINEFLREVAEDWGNVQGDGGFIGDDR